MEKKEQKTRKQLSKQLRSNEQLDKQLRKELTKKAELYERIGIIMFILPPFIVWTFGCFFKEIFRVREIRFGLAVIVWLIISMIGIYIWGKGGDILQELYGE